MALTSNGVGTCGADDNQAQAGHLIVDATAYQCHGTNVGPMGTLRQGNGAVTGGVPFVVQPLALRGREGGAEIELAPIGSPSHALRTPGGGSSHAMVCVTGDVTHTLTSEGADASEDGTRRGTPIVTAPPVAATLTAGTSSPGVSAPGRRQEDDHNLVVHETVVRRLTELECERLQGYPDEYTAGQSGSARYRQLGNSIAVPVFEWLAHRVVAVDREVRS